MAPRRVVLLLPLLAVAACANQAGPDSPAERFAIALEHADGAAGIAVARMDAFERLVLRENAAIAFAGSGRPAGAPRIGPPPSGAAEATGRVITPAFAVLGDYAHVLADLTSGVALTPRAPNSGAFQVAQAEEGLRLAGIAAGVTVPEPTRSAGLAAMRTLSDLAQQASIGGQRSVPALVTAAQPQVAAIAAMLRSLIGPEAGQGVRGALRASREGLDARQSAFLAKIAADRRLGTAERYGLFRSVAELREADPAQGTFLGIIGVLDSMEVAHAALSAPFGDASAKVGEFETAVARLGALSEASRRAAPGSAPAGTMPSAPPPRGR
jgi:hypothetical protein